MTKISNRNIIGEKFGRLSVFKLDCIDKKYYHKHYLCKCECGNIRSVNIYKLNSGHTKSCGCITKDRLRNSPKSKHGMYNTTLYRVWIRMRSRCYNENDKAYQWYGGRGLKVSSEWDDFRTFYKDMGDEPTKLHTLERIDNNIGYSKENCKWATMSEQGNNRRSNVNITYNGRTQTISTWAKDIGVSHSTMSKRIKRWALKDALTKPKYECKVQVKSDNRAT